MAENNKESNKFQTKAEKRLDKIKLASFNKQLNKSETLLKGLVSAAQPLVDVLNLASERTTVFNKQLGLSDSEANKLSKELSSAADFSDNLATNSIRASKALGLINKSLGTGTSLFKEQAVTVSRFATTLGISEKAQSNLAQLSKQQGVSVKDLVKSQIGVVKNVEAEFGVRLDIAEAAKESLEVSGQIRSQLGGNLEEITKTVAVTKELGFELAAVASAGGQLLNFQENISSELEAELLTGRQLNLEQARLFALTGDYAGLTEEIKNNVGDFLEFSKLNVLQQNAIAKAVGMSSDQLSDQLFKNMTLAELEEARRTETDADTLKRLEQLNIQEKFNLLQEKFLSIVVSIATPLAQIFEHTGFIVAGFSILAAMSFTSFIASLVPLVSLLTTGAGAAAAMSSALTFGVGALAIAAGIATIYGAYQAFTNADDLAISPGGATHIMGPAGNFKLNSQDSIVAGTDLGGGEKRRSDEEIVALAARSISVNFNTPKFNSLASVDAIFA